ncbi:hypothetical protein B0H66DRAFT_86454 [Apodospora peruviana]|uniref:Uncharacterized protein n=1 Tax=Apodospora peruviana TaxID=516989 RepID=A0AAE0ITX6_9PEZI|nr:hypothetical protein B0H66DRAFT_86454 [Apodospora peruviana]
MTELLVQSSLAESRGNQLAIEVSKIRQKCAADHGDKPVVECPECYEKVLEATRSRYRRSSTAHQEWFTTRRVFLQELDAMFADAKEYQLDPSKIDARVREERSRWYAENVRASLLRLMVEDPAGREAVFEKLEEPPSDLAGLPKDITDILSKGLHPAVGVADVPDRLAAAKDSDSRVRLLKEAFFGNGDDEANLPEDHQKYFEMLKHGLSMEQVVDRILEDRQASIGAREQTEKLKRRLKELNAARAAHELQKSRKARNKASFADQRVPEELYNIPPCAVCREVPNPQEFLCCQICAVLVGRGVQDQQHVYCTPECEGKGHSTHADTHTCASGDDCIELQYEDDTMENDGMPSNSGDKTNFCVECLSSFKLPTQWCSLACAGKDFQHHREAVHLPWRKKLGLDGEVADRLSYDSVAEGDSTTESTARRYHAKDIAAETISLQMLVTEWEEKNGVHLET